MRASSPFAQLDGFCPSGYHSERRERIRVRPRFPDDRPLSWQRALFHWHAAPDWLPQVLAEPRSNLTNCSLPGAVNRTPSRQYEPEFPSRDAAAAVRSVSASGDRCSLAVDLAPVIKQIKDASDIVAIVGSYIALKPAGQMFRGLCPFHNDSRPSLNVDPRWQNYKCWACGKFGDVIHFVQEFDKVPFIEALETLGRRANIALPNRGDSASIENRSRMLDVLRWATERYQSCLLDLPVAEPARKYLAERKLAGETVRRFQLGFAPPSGDWLTRQASDAPGPFELLVQVGLLAKSSQGDGWYDRFRDRVMFPIRDVRGQVVGFGGRILPNSHLAARSAKYYNTSDTELFKKSELIYGLDQARLAGQAAGCLAVVEGYTDVLMAHQHGVGHVVATMGTALTAQHVRQLRRYAPKVVLVYDADAGGSTGVDRALELFIREDIDLDIATLPEGQDPCDLLSEQGADPFKSALTAARDALDHKLDQVLAKSAGEGVEGTRRAVDAVLGILALIPEGASPAAMIKQEIVIGRVAQRFGLRSESLLKRLAEIRRDAAAQKPPSAESTAGVPGKAAAPAEPLERELLEVLLAEPALVATVRNSIAPEDIRHPGLRRLLDGLYELQDDGAVPDLDALRLKLADNPALADYALKMQDVGRMHADRRGWLDQITLMFQGRREKQSARELQSKLTATKDHAASLDLLRKLQERNLPPPV